MDKKAVGQEKGAFPRDAGQRFMVAGAGLYLCTVLLSATQLATAYGARSQLVEAASASMVLLGSIVAAVVAMIVIAGFFRRFTDARAQKALAAAVAIAAVLEIALRTPPAAALPYSGALCVVLESIGNACSVMFWGLNFIALDKREAERTIVASLDLALALYLVCSAAAPSEDALSYAVPVASALAVLPFLANRYRIDLVRRENDTPNRRMLGSFWATRAFLGGCQGAAAFLCMSLTGETAQRSPVLCLVALAVLVACMALWQRTDDDGVAFLRFAPFTVCGLVVCPFLGQEGTVTSLCCCAPAFVWTGWIILHSVQLSAIKNSCGIDDALLSFTEKIAFMGSSAVMLAVLNAVPQLSQALSGGDYLQVSLLAVIVFAAMMVSLVQLTRVIDGKETERIVDNALELSDRRFEPVIAKVGERYGLTAREIDAMRLLARNMTYTSICEELCISEGTVRTHLWHIYQKMDIHSRDELVAIVEREIHEQVGA